MWAKQLVNLALCVFILKATFKCQVALPVVTVFKRHNGPEVRTHKYEKKLMEEIEKNLFKQFSMFLQTKYVKRRALEKSVKQPEKRRRMPTYPCIYFCLYPAPRRQRVVCLCKQQY